MRVIDGREVQCEVTGMVDLEVLDVQMGAKMSVITNIDEGVDIEMGIDVIRKLSGVLISKEGVEIGLSAAKRRTESRVIDPCVV